MKVKKIKSSKALLELSIEGEGHTFANLLRANATSLGAVASYHIDHPLVGSPHLSVRSDDAKEVLKKASQKIQKDAKEFKKLIGK